MHVTEALVLQRLESSRIWRRVGQQIFIGLYVFNSSIFSVQAVQEDWTTRTMKMKVVKSSEMSVKYFLNHKAS